MTQSAYDKLEIDIHEKYIKLYDNLCNRRDKGMEPPILDPDVFFYREGYLAGYKAGIIHAKEC